MIPTNMNVRPSAQISTSLSISAPTGTASQGTKRAPKPEKKAKARVVAPGLTVRKHPVLTPQPRAYGRQGTSITRTDSTKAQVAPEIVAIREAEAKVALAKSREAEFAQDTSAVDDGRLPTGTSTGTGTSAGTGTSTSTGTGTSAGTSAGTGTSTSTGTGTSTSTGTGADAGDTEGASDPDTAQTDTASGSDSAQAQTDASGRVFAEKEGSSSWMIWAALGAVAVGGTYLMLRRKS